MAQTKLDKDVSVASQNFQQDWKDSVGVPIEHITKRISSLETGKRDVVVTSRVAR